MPNIIEIKARSNQQERIREILRNKKALEKGIDHQVDTYFKVNEGRLKLREGNIENHLIHYHRNNQAGPKLSQVTLYPSQPASNLKKILTDSLGILTVVDKKREIYFIDNVKFHIDIVKDLGTFIEIEAIDDSNEVPFERLQEQCEYYLQLFDVREENLVSVSYSDLLLNKVE